MITHQYIHIVSFDIPYPPDYGGIIDVFYKIKYLHKEGFKIILHAFQYNQKKITHLLDDYCEKIYYYPRNMSIKKFFSPVPFTIISRKNEQLIENLMQDQYPILFDTLHTAYYIHHPLLQNRKKILRLSNIEHHYYYHLFLSEKNFSRKLYFLIESIKLYFYEKHAFRWADIILPVTDKDDKYVKQYYASAKSFNIPSFHAYNDMSISKGKGNYLLYHGNLSVPENYRAVAYLLDNIANKISYPIIIAGKNPPSFLINKIKAFKHVQLVKNPDDDEMKQLIQNAHIIWLYTNQPTGLKLKLIHSLFTARFIICNSFMIAGTNLTPNPSLFIANTPQQFIDTISHLQEQDFDDFSIFHRKQLLNAFDNKKNIEKLISVITEK